jgi:hypothetical protein
MTDFYYRWTDDDMHRHAVRIPEGFRESSCWNSGERQEAARQIKDWTEIDVPADAVHTLTADPMPNPAAWAGESSTIHEHKTEGDTTTTKNIEKMASLAGWDLAKELGCHFAGDCNYTDHNGYFYDAREWRRNGYAPIVNFCRVADDQDALRVECATVNRPDDMADCLKSCGWKYDGTGSAIAIVDDYSGEVIADELDVMARVEIEACKDYQGAETGEDFSGPYVQRFEDGTEDRAILKDVIGWIENLAE